MEAVRWTQIKAADHFQNLRQLGAFARGLCIVFCRASANCGVVCGWICVLSGGCT